MGTVPKNDPVRDRNLIKDYLEESEDGGWKYPITSLGLKYAREVDGVLIPLSASRIYQVLNKYGIPKRRIAKGKKTNDDK